MGPSLRANQTTSPAGVAKQAPTEQQETKPGLPKRFATGQTVCNEKNEKGKLCNGHLKQLRTACFCTGSANLADLRRARLR